MTRWERVRATKLVAAALPGGNPPTDSFWHVFESKAPWLLQFGLRCAVWTLGSWPTEGALHWALEHRWMWVRQLALVVKWAATFAHFDPRPELPPPPNASSPASPPDPRASPTVPRGSRPAPGARWDAVVVGSGPGGSAAALALAEAGARVLVLEAGDWVGSSAGKPMFSAMASLYCGLGATLCRGTPMAVVQGRAVGGTSVVNGAICWRLPKDVHEAWNARDPRLAWDWGALERTTDSLVERLHIKPTDPAISGAHNLLFGKGAERLGLEHRPVHRNVLGCEGLGKCLQACPAGKKLSMDRTVLQDAIAKGATVLAGVTVERILSRQGRAVGVEATDRDGKTCTFDADKVILAAGAVATPALLLKSGLGGPAVGRFFQCHPGVSVAGRFAEPVRLWEGATQGHEVTGLRREGLKFEALGYGPALVALRAPGIGAELRRQVDDLDHLANWGAAIRAEAHGRVDRCGVVHYRLGRPDLERTRRAVAVLGRLLFAAGAEWVSPGVHGWPSTRDPSELDRFEREGPLTATAYSLAATHLFSSCRAGSDPTTSAVRPDLRHHAVEGLYVADASVLPTNIGVNPQLSILAIVLTAAREGMARG